MRRDVPLALRSRSFLADRVAWLVFAAVVALATVGTRAWLHRRVPLHGAVAAAAATRDFRLAVLAWDRVDERGVDAHVDAARLAEQLDALRAAGFTPVTLRQVREAFRGAAPLPVRAVLLTFDGGHLSTWRAVDPVLRRLGWPAAMLLDPHVPERRDGTYVYWDRLRRMIDSGLWEVGTLEPDPAAARLVARRLGGHEVLASSRARSGAPQQGPALTFESSLFGVNDRSSDPRRLFRIRVPREWSGRDLVERLAYSLEVPAAPTCDDAPPVPAARWVRGAGRLETAADTLTLTGAPRAEAWLAGGEWARDFVLEAEVRPERGAFWIVHQAVGSREQWRFGGVGRTLYLQRLRPGAPVEVVSRVELRAAETDAWHAVRVVKRGSGVWIEWDGAPIADMPRSVGSRWRGDVGLTTGGPAEPGRVAVRSARFAAIPYRIRAVGARPGAAEVRELLREAPCLAAIRPPGLLDPGGARRPANARLISMLAARGAWDLAPPVVDLAPLASADVWQRTFRQRAERALLDGRAP